MPDSFALAGAIVAPVIVVCGLLYFVYRGRSELAGALAGFPTVTALVTASASFQHGEHSLLATTLGIEKGLLATATFLLVYRASKKHAAWRAFAGYFAALGVAAAGILCEPLARSYVIAAAIALTATGFRRHELAPVQRQRSIFQIAAPLTASLLLSAASKLLAAHTLGLLTPFPSTIFPLLLYTQRRQPGELPQVIGGVARGLVGTLVFAISLRYAIAAELHRAWWVAMCAAAVSVIAQAALTAWLRTVVLARRRITQ